MNPKNPQELDPKLKEAYDRVMGTTMNPAAPQPNSAPQATQPVLTSIPPVPPGLTPVEKPAQEKLTNTLYPQANSKSGMVSLKKKPVVSPIILVLAGFVFFVVYTLVCLKIFGIF